MDYASVTAVRDGAHTTVAASSVLAVAVDQAQYAELDGPCVEALHLGVPTAVPDVDATMQWPGFREAAIGMGIRAALSVPLVDGSGTTIAALNLFGHDRVAMAALDRHVHAVHHGDPEATTTSVPLGPGDADLLAGLAGALAILDTIQQGIGLTMAHHGCSADGAYLILRDRAAETGRGLVEVAAAARDAQRPSGGSGT